MIKKLVGVFVPDSYIAVQEFERLSSEMKVTKQSRRDLQLETTTTVYKIFATNYPDSWLRWCCCEFSDVMLNSKCNPEVLSRIVVKLRL